MSDLREKVAKTLEQVRPYLKKDGGDVEFVDVDANKVVHVRLKGACAGCPASFFTLKAGIEAFLKEEIPEIKEVVDDSSAK